MLDGRTVGHWGLAAVPLHDGGFNGRVPIPGIRCGNGAEDCLIERERVLGTLERFIGGSRLPDDCGFSERTGFSESCAVACEYACTDRNSDDVSHSTSHDTPSRYNAAFTCRRLLKGARTRACSCTSRGSKAMATIDIAPDRCNS